MKNALASLDAYEAAVDKKAAESTSRKTDLQALLCKLVKARAPYRYLTAVSAVLSRLEADERELYFLSGVLWCRSTDEFLKSLHTA